ncbi:MAG: FAD-dependent oxidoreductase [Rhodothermia bacterium]|nr:MAG: FAD-dependent oxidoreductase [Rhodothermia bacterium]
MASGTAAAAEARRVDPDAQIVLFEQNAEISYGACEIPLFLEGTITDPYELIAFTPERFEEERGVRVRSLTRVDRFEPRSGVLAYTSLADRVTGIEKFDKFILATGASAVSPDLPGIEAENVFTVRDLQDAISLERYISTTPIQHAVVVGGGFIGIEIAESVTHRGIRVTMLQPAPGPLHNHLEDSMAQMVTKLLERGGVSVRDERLAGLEASSDDRVNAVKTVSGEMVGCQLVILAMGIVPNVGLGIEAGIKTGNTGAYRVNDQMRTNRANVWACGDCVEVERIIDGRSVLSPLSLTAFKTGRVSGRNAARRGTHKPARFEGVVMAQGLKVFDDEVAYLGLTESAARESGFSATTVTIRHRTKAALAPGSRSIHVTLVFETSRGRILGAQLVGGPGTVLRANTLIPLIRKGATVSDLYEQDLIYAPPFSPRLDPLLVAARKAIRKMEDIRVS